MRFREAREKAGLSAVEAAYMLGVSVTAIYSWEAGVYTPETKRLADIKRVYHCTVDELLGLNDHQRDSA